MKKMITWVCLSMLPMTYAAAEGYQVNAQSTKQAGMAHVGAAMKLGAESMHFNPAGLVFMDKDIHLSAGVAGVFTNASYDTADKTYSFDADSKASTPLYLYAGFKIYDNLAAGVSLTTPFGNGIRWGDNWKGAHLIQEINLKAFNIQPDVYGAGRGVLPREVIKSHLKSVKLFSFCVRMDKVKIWSLFQGEIPFLPCFKKAAFPSIKRAGAMKTKMSFVFPKIFWE